MLVDSAQNTRSALQMDSNCKECDTFAQPLPPPGGSSVKNSNLEAKKHV